MGAGMDSDTDIASLSVKVAPTAATSALADATSALATMLRRPAVARP